MTPETLQKLKDCQLIALAPEMKEALLFVYNEITLGYFAYRPDTIGTIIPLMEKLKSL